MAATTDDLSTWLVERAGVSPKFLDAILATCDEQMIGTVDNLAMLQSGGQLGSVFKPVIASSIESALSSGSGSGGGGASVVAAAVGAVGTVSAVSANSAGAPALSLQDVKRQLMINRQSTWGNEAELRTNLDMFLKQVRAPPRPRRTPTLRAWRPYSSTHVVPARRRARAALHRSRPPRPAPHLPAATSAGERQARLVGLRLSDLGQRLRAGGRSRHRCAGRRAGRTAGRRGRSAAAGRRASSCGGGTSCARTARWCGASLTLTRLSRNQRREQLQIRDAGAGGAKLEQKGGQS